MGLPRMIVFAKCQPKYGIICSSIATSPVNTETKNFCPANNLCFFNPYNGFFSKSNKKNNSRFFLFYGFHSLSRFIIVNKIVATPSFTIIFCTIVHFVHFVLIFDSCAIVLDHYSIPLSNTTFIGNQNVLPSC